MLYPWNRAVVIGASSGIGEAIARRLLAEGLTVALVARRLDAMERICAEATAANPSAHATTYVHDVRNTGEVQELFQRIALELGGVDLVVYSSGIMPDVGADEYPTGVDVATVETNFTGAAAWLNEAATRFSRAGAGTIIGLSSVAGNRGRRKGPVYGATKAALDVYLESLRNRLAHRGVTVVTIKLGYVRTPLIEGLTLSKLFPAISAETAADGILSAAGAGKRIAYVPWWWRVVMRVISAIPPRIFERLKI